MGLLDFTKKKKATESTETDAETQTQQPETEQKKGVIKWRIEPSEEHPLGRVLKKKKQEWQEAEEQ